jgi:LacI family transcriptional regulator
MRVRLKDIADAVGVQPPTVSVGLNNKQTTIRVSDETRQRILDVAREMGYIRDASALALSTGKTGRLGVILSDTVTSHWANPYFAQLLTGAEAASREAGYGLQISSYNISNIEGFITPHKIATRAVDGYVLLGSTDADVLDKLRQLDVPFVCIKETEEDATPVDSVVSDLKGVMIEAMEYAAGMGHRRFALLDTPEAWRVKMAENLVKQLPASLQGCSSTTRPYSARTTRLLPRLSISGRAWPRTCVPPCCWVLRISFWECARSWQGAG